MALSVSFFLVYSKAKILSESLQNKPVSVRCQVRFTRSHLNWSGAKLMGHDIIRIQFTTPAKAMPRYWANGKVKHTHPNALEINNIIDSISARANTIHSQYIAAGAFPTDKEFITAILGSTEAATTASTLFGYYDTYIQYLVDRNVTRVTCIRHKSILKILRDFQTQTGYHLEFDTINKTFAAKFVAWCIRNLPKHRKLQDIERNTVPRYLKDLRNFLSHAHSEGWTTAIMWRKIRHNLKHNSFPVTITDAEITRLWALTPADLDAGRKSKYSAIITRDWFLLGTQTALRWSDWRNRQFRFIHIGEGQYNLQFVQEKTDDALEIPLSGLAVDILNRYDWAMPAVFSPASTMQHLDALARAAGIGKHLTSHTARRTFCTLQEAASVPRGIIMRITGHRTEKDYLRYTGITYKVNADMMRRANPAMFEIKKSG